MEASESSPQAKALLGQLLVSGGTNACADNLAAGAAAAGLTVARVGNPARVQPPPSCGSSCMRYVGMRWRAPPSQCVWGEAVGNAMHLAP